MKRRKFIKSMFAASAVAATVTPVALMAKEEAKKDSPKRSKCFTP